MYLFFLCIAQTVKEITLDLNVFSSFTVFPFSLLYLSSSFFLWLHLLPTRTVNNSRTESSPTSTGEASVSASSSTGSSHLPDAGLDLSADRREEAEQPQASQSQLGEEDKDTLDTKKDEQLG